MLRFHSRPDDVYTTTDFAVRIASVWYRNRLTFSGPSSPRRYFPFRVSSRSFRRRIWPSFVSMSSFQISGETRAISFSRFFALSGGESCAVRPFRTFYNVHRVRIYSRFRCVLTFFSLRCVHRIRHSLVFYILLNIGRSR